MELSIVIPVLDDAPALERCLAALAVSGAAHRRRHNGSAEYEVIVVDGGPSAECRRIAEKSGAAYLEAPRGRARQMNAGARLARGKWLWFLHADCVPHADSIHALTQLDPPVQWGCFRHRIDAPGVCLRVIEKFDNLRARSGVPYGDQGIFVRRDVFEKVGGYADVPILEDVLLAKALGPRSFTLASSQFEMLWPLLKTDARRWKTHGILATTLINLKILRLHLVHKRPLEELAELYRNPCAHRLLQLHLATCVVLMLAASVLVGMNVHGQRVNVGFPRTKVGHLGTVGHQGTVTYTLRTHGWPVALYARWEYPAEMQPAKTAGGWYPEGLAVDIPVAGAILLFVSVVSETIIRRRAALRKQRQL